MREPADAFEVIHRWAMGYVECPTCGRSRPAEKIQRYPSALVGQPEVVTCGHPYCFPTSAAPTEVET